MRIGIDARVLMDREYSGVSLYTLNLIRELLQIDQDNKYILYYNSFNNIKHLIPKFNQSNVEIVNTRYPNKIFNYILQKIFKWPKLDKVIGGVDIFLSPHINFTNLSKDSKHILTIHDLSFVKYPEFFSWRKNIWHKLINIKKMAERADAIVAISANTKNDITKELKQAEDKVSLIYPGLLRTKELGVESNNYLRSVKDKYELPDKFILFLSTIEPRKNALGLLEAFENIADSEEMKDYYLVIVGTIGWKSRQTMNFYHKMKHQNRVKMIGYLDEKEKVCFYKLASIFVYPSFYEGFGFPPLEAMACGVPVVTSANSSLLESVCDAALLVDPDNVSSISQALVSLADDEKLRQRFVSKGLKQAEKFNWTSTARQYLEIFKKLKSY